MKKLQTLQNILNYCGLDEFDLNDYDFTQPDSMDESDSGGAWDAARDIADTILEQYSVDGVETLQSLLYNLFCAYKTEIDPDETDKTQGE